MSVPQATLSAATTTTNSTGNSSVSSRNLSNHDQFMELMLKELTYQDPLKPMTTAELAQQMLTLQQVQSNESLQSKLDKLGHSLMLNATNLLGRSVTVLDPNTQKELTGSVQALRSRDNGFEVVINGKPYSGDLIKELQ